MYRHHPPRPPTPAQIHTHEHTHTHTRPQTHTNTHTRTHARTHRLAHRVGLLEESKQIRLHSRGVGVEAIVVADSGCGTTKRAFGQRAIVCRVIIASTSCRRRNSCVLLESWGGWREGWIRSITGAGLLCARGCACEAKQQCRYTQRKHGGGLLLASRPRPVAREHFLFRKHNNRTKRATRSKRKESQQQSQKHTHVRTHAHSRAEWRLGGGDVWCYERCEVRGELNSLPLALVCVCV